MNTKTLKPENKDVFRFLNSINYTKEDLSNELDFSDYNDWFTQQGLSFHIDTIILANIANLNSNIAKYDKRMLYRYLLHIVRKRKRFGKWIKGEHEDDLSLIMDYYDVNAIKAKAALKLLTKEQLEILREKQNKGG